MIRGDTHHASISFTQITNSPWSQTLCGEDTCTFGYAMKSCATRRDSHSRRGLTINDILFLDTVVMKCLGLCGPEAVVEKVYTQRSEVKGDEVQRY